MNYKDILQTAMRQSAVDLSCSADDFTATENKVVISRYNESARRYLTLPFYCQLVSYGNNIVASVDEEMYDFVGSYINKYGAVHSFETPNLHVLNDELKSHGQSICFMAEYFLPDPENVKRLECGYELREMSQCEFAAYYLPEWSNALCDKRKENDMLVIGAFDGKRLVGLAGASADCETMWQIGVDVLPEYRNNGIAATLTSQLAFRIMELGKVPFYCAAWSNIKSVRNAIKCGFKPSWVEVTSKSVSFVDKMNGV